MEIVCVEWKKGDNGRFEMVEVVGLSEIIEVDFVFLVMGFLGLE